MNEIQTYSFIEQLPERAFYWLSTDRDGAKYSYLLQLSEIHRYIALYGRPETVRWSYEPLPGSKVC